MVSSNMGRRLGESEEISCIFVDLFFDVLESK